MIFIQRGVSSLSLILGKDNELDKNHLPPQIMRVLISHVSPRILLNPNLFRKYYSCEPHNTLTTRCQLFYKCKKNVPWRYWTNIPFSNIFISNNERHEIALNTLYITVHFSSKLLCYIFILLQYHPTKST